jgi:hypothetical protein
VRSSGCAHSWSRATGVVLTMLETPVGVEAKVTATSVCNVVCLYVYMYCACVCVCVYIYIYIYIYTHTHIHTSICCMSTTTVRECLKAVRQKHVSGTPHHWCNKPGACAPKSWRSVYTESRQYTGNKYQGGCRKHGRSQGSGCDVTRLSEEAGLSDLALKRLDNILGPVFVFFSAVHGFIFLSQHLTSADSGVEICVRACLRGRVKGLASKTNEKS